MFSLPLKHRELHEQKPEVIFQDRQILYTYLREKLVTVGDVCQLHSIDLPEFKVGKRGEVGEWVMDVLVADGNAGFVGDDE